MQPRFRTFLIAATIYVPAMLLADGHIPQLLLGLTTLLFLVAFANGNKNQIICAILVATTGEIVLSLGWGLYTYSHALIPLYVPFGHGIFYALAAESARQPALQRHARAITRSVLIAGSVIAAVSLIFFHDQWGLLWWIAVGVGLAATAAAGSDSWVARGISAAPMAALAALTALASRPRQP